MEADQHFKSVRLAQIVLFNSVPAVGVLFFGWDAKLLILAYFTETLIAILFHALRLWYVNFRWGSEPETKYKAAELERANGGQRMPVSFLPVFMMAFYGLFCFVQLMILGGFAEREFPDGIFTHLYRAAIGPLAWAIGSFVFLQTSRLFMEAIRSEYAFTPAEAIFFQPFRRILVQQLAVILGGFFILLSGVFVYVFLLVLVNLALDLFFFFIDNAKLKSILTKGDPEAVRSYEELKKLKGMF